MWKHVKNGKVVVKAELNDKTKTYILFFEDGEKLACASTTFKRWYKQIDDTVTEETKEEETTEEANEVVADEDTCADGRKYADIGKEIAEQAKEKAKKAKSAKEKESSGITVEEAHKLITEQVKKSGYDVSIKDSTSKNVWVVVGNKKKMSVYVGGKKCVLGLPSALVPEGYKADRIRNCSISHSFDISYDSMDRLSEIISKVNVNKEEK